MAQEAATTMTTSTPTMLEIAQTRLDRTDLDFEVTTEADAKYVEEFQDAWSQFLTKRPDLVPAGQRAVSLETLAAQAQQENLSLEAVEWELEKQLEFFGSSRENLENMFQTKIHQAMERQRALHDELQSRLDVVASADQLQQQTLPWQNFLHQADKLAEQNTTTNTATAATEASTFSSKVAKPSARAVTLTDQQGDASDVLLRTYRTDHALLTSDIVMLQKEIERCSKTVESQEVAGAFLSEHNVWSLLSSSSGNNKEGSATESTRTGGTNTLASQK